jgi:hypothetical protein
MMNTVIYANGRVGSGVIYRSRTAGGLFIDRSVGDMLTISAVQTSFFFFEVLLANTENE